MTIRASGTGQCPHCRTGVRFETVHIMGTSQLSNQSAVRIQTLSQHAIEVIPVGCPQCGKPILVVSRLFLPTGAQSNVETVLWPDAADRPVPSEVEKEAPQLANDFREAALVFSKSKKASAALSRRCLQYILVNKGGATAKDLAGQIDQVLPHLPAELARNVDAIRHVGNFAAHPMKSTSTGEIVNVEDGEAEWLLEVLEELFGFYYVGPARAASRRDALNAKLKQLGKPPLKAP